MYRKYVDGMKPEVRRDDGSLIVVGDRVVSDEHLATIKYIGEVPPTKGLWLGVDWDDSGRGKHNGSHDAIKYFNTREETSGSFLRPQKVNLGITLLAAVKERYGLKTEDDAGVVTDELFVLSADKTPTVVEMIGAKKLNLKQSKIEDLQEVDVKSMSVYGAGQDEISTSSIEKLNLSANLISSWQQVADIVRQLPKLKELILSQNILKLPKDTSSLSSCFNGIRSVVLNNANYTWKELLLCCNMLQMVESLSFSYNSLSSLSAVSDCLSYLTFLALENNNLTDWKHVLHLGNLHRLETLALNKNEIESIEFPDTKPGEKTPLFPNLNTLYLHRNKISQWSSINELGKLRKINNIMLLFNPINETESIETVRQLHLAKISTLTLLNRSQVFNAERKGAEIDYLKRFGKQWREAGGSQDDENNKPNVQFLTEHPRYLDLLKKWGAPEDSELVQQSTKLKDNLVCVKLSSLQNVAKGIIEKKLPQTMTVQKVRGLVQRLFKADPSTLQLSYSSQKMDGPNIEMDNDLRQLCFYSIESGDTIYAKW